MNKKASMWGFILGAVILVVLLFISLNLFGKTIIPGAKEATNCPATCTPKDDACKMGTTESQFFQCKKGDDGAKFKCCLSAEEIAEAQNKGTAGGASGTTPGAGTGTPGTGTPGTGSAGSNEGTDGGKLFVQKEADTTNLLPPVYSMTLTVGQTSTITIWSEGQKTNLCSAYLLDMTNDVRTKVVAGTWFNGEVTKQDCNTPNKKIITITPTADLVGKNYRLNMMLYKDSSASTYGASARIDMTVVAATLPEGTQTPPADTGSIHLQLNGADKTLGSSFERNCGNTDDTFTIWEDMPSVKYCKIFVPNYIYRENININSNGYGFSEYSASCDSANKLSVLVKYDSSAPTDCKSLFGVGETSKQIIIKLNKMNENADEIGTVSVATINLRKE